MAQPRLLRFWVVFVITAVLFYPWGVAAVVLTLLRSRPAGSRVRTPLLLLHHHPG
ncbi:hypothetical protein [Rhodococcus rhodochrous]|uniref:Uncharacterized protein n=1 Tax=Rhodococcus rhodochrous TaxID=1829 RepID=A0AA47A7P0_RHORH|nr:hypothetical protein [Rhodococcus rhodochrous]UZF43056.1 hypothetical protein KUM34_014110 [Rhodococcus rhodochrous]